MQGLEEPKGGGIRKRKAGVGRNENSVPRNKQIQVYNTAGGKDEDGESEMGWVYHQIFYPLRQLIAGPASKEEDPNNARAKKGIGI